MWLDFVHGQGGWVCKESKRATGTHSWRPGPIDKFQGPKGSQVHEARSWGYLWKNSSTSVFMAGRKTNSEQGCLGKGTVDQGSVNTGRALHRDQKQLSLLLES
jgi:hypothetical protein